MTKYYFIITLRKEQKNKKCGPHAQLVLEGKTELLGHERQRDAVHGWIVACRASITRTLPRAGAFAAAGAIVVPSTVRTAYISVI